MAASFDLRGSVQMLLGACAVAALLGFSSDTPVDAHGRQMQLQTHDPVAMQIARAVGDDPGLNSFYATRDYRPLWTQEASARFFQILAKADMDGIDPARISTPTQQSLSSEARGVSDVMLSRAFANYVRALRTPSEPSRMVYVDPELAPVTDTLSILREAAAAPSLTGHIDAVRKMHALYETMRAALHDYRSKGVNPSTLPDAVYEQRLLINLDRLRALPPLLPRRYILVDTASARLWMYEGGKPVHEMAVIVGTIQHQTPSLAGLIRFSVRNPYWNLPPDLARARAQRIVSDGPALLERERLELLSDWSANPRQLMPGEVDWQGVADGATTLRMRQKPGAGNMMGAVKFMLPNRMGIYLHDTPGKTSFARKDRRLSSGCVRVADARLLYRWLMEGDDMTGTVPAETRVALPRPVPVYILYLTAVPGKSGIMMQDDVYGRDSALSVDPVVARTRMPPRTKDIAGSEEGGLTIGKVALNASVRLSAHPLAATYDRARV